MPSAYGNSSMASSGSTAMEPTRSSSTELKDGKKKNFLKKMLA